MRMPNLIASALCVAVVALLVRDRTPAVPPAPGVDGGQAAGAIQPEWPASLAFEPNQGQADDRVRFLARGPDYTLFLTDGGVVARLAPGGREDVAHGERTNPRGDRSAVVAMTLASANPSPRVTGELPQAGVSNYFIGNDPSAWQRNVRQFGQVRYEDIYAGIDAVYYGTQGELEYDFVVAPGADPGVIALDFAGVDGMSLDTNGNLVLDTGNGALVQRRPVVYQVVDGARQVIDAAYRMLDVDTVGFALGQFDRTLPLVIDPVLSYNTYLGGDGEDKAGAVAVDAAGNAWVAGNTASLEFSWDFGLEDTEYTGGESDAYVCRFNAVGGVPLCAYIGGTGYDDAMAVAIGGDGNTYVGGYTDSFDFPIVAAAQSARGGGEWGDAFVLKVNDSADGLEFSTYLGGNDADELRALATDPTGGVYATGHTWSWEGFPLTPGAYTQTDIAGADAFVTRVSRAGAFVASTLLGGTADDMGRGVTVDRAGRVTVTGSTDSVDFPVRGAFQATHGGTVDATIAKFDANLSTLLYATYLGGAGEEWAYDVNLDAAGAIHVAGITTSADFPVSNALQSTFGGVQDGFLVKLAPNGVAPIFSTYLGGSDFDDVRHMRLDPEGNLHVAGYTSSTDFPLPGTLQPVRDRDAVVVMVAANGARVLQGTAIGGSGVEVVSGMDLDTEGNVLVTGWTYSSDLPVAAAFQDVLANDVFATEGGDMFIARMSGPSVASWPGDFNGDGADDIVWRNNATGQAAIWYSGNARSAANLSRVANLDWRIVGAGDFDGDGKSDLLWRNLVTGANAIWRSGNSATSLATTSVTNTNWQVHGIGDFDGDGTDDIAWHDITLGETALWYGGDSATATSLFRIGNLAWDIVGAGDFDGDGKADLLWRNSSAGQNVAWLSGNYLSQMVIAGVAGQAWRIVGIGDFQGDGKDDLVWRNVVEGRNTIWRGASSTQAQAVAGVPRQTWQIVGTGDYNGDGKADLFWRDNLFGGNMVWPAGSAGSAYAVTGVRNQAWAPKS